MALWLFLLTIEMWEFTTWVAKEPEGYQGEISKDIFNTKLKAEYSAKNFPGQSQIVKTFGFGRPLALWPLLLTIEMWEFTTWVAKEPEGYQGEINWKLFHYYLQVLCWILRNVVPTFAMVCAPLWDKHNPTLDSDTAQWWQGHIEAVFVFLCNISHDFFLNYLLLNHSKIYSK